MILNKCIKFYIDILLDSIISILSSVVPKNKNSILLGSSSGNSFVGSPKYFYLYLLRRKYTLKVYWITRNKELFEYLDSKDLPVIYLHSWKGFFSILTSHYLVIEVGPADVSYIGLLVGNFNIVHAWHGTPLKKIVSDVYKNLKGVKNTLYHKLLTGILQKYCLIISPSKSVSTNFRTAFPKSKNNVRILGYPRNDVFFNKRLLVEDYYSKLNCKEYKKIILYCPTFRDNPTLLNPFTEKILEKLNKYLAENNYIFLVKRHPGDKELKVKIFSNIKDISDEVEDIQEILIFTDIIITDYSGVLFDFALTDRPVILYPYDYEFYLKNCRDMYYDFYNEMPGPFANNENDLFDLILNVDNWFNSEGYQKKYRDFKNKFNYYQDGKSSERLYNFLIINDEKKR